jgi:hypothetical protein
VIINNIVDNATVWANRSIPVSKAAAVEVWITAHQLWIMLVSPVAGRRRPKSLENTIAVVRREIALASAGAAKWRGYAVSAARPAKTDTGSASDRLKAAPGATARRTP